MPKVLMLCTGQRHNWHICLNKLIKLGAQHSNKAHHVQGHHTDHSTREASEFSFITTWTGCMAWSYVRTHTHIHTYMFHKSWEGQGNLSVTPRASTGLPVAFSPSPHHTHSYTDPSTVHPRPSQVEQLWCQQDLGLLVYLI